MSAQDKEMLDLAVELAKAAGALQRDAFAEDVSISEKSTEIDLVTDIDHRSEELLLSGIKERFPDHVLMAEESGAEDRDGEFRWIVDPLDGTVNYAHKIPHFAVLIAIQEQEAGDYVTKHGITYDPMREELFIATRGEGVSLNGKAITVSPTQRLLDSTLATGFPYGRLFGDYDNHAEFCRMNLLSQGVRRFGSAGLDLAYVACGRFDGYWEYHLNAWDIAGGLLMVNEAGGRVTNFAGGDADIFKGQIVAGNQVLHGAMLKALASAKTEEINSRAHLAEHLPADVAKRIKE